MKVILCSLALALAFMTPHAHSQDAPSTAAAQDAALMWLALIDAGNFGTSWDEAADIFQQHIAKTAWASAAANARTPLGAVISRKLASARYAKTLPGAPDGEYVVIQFSTHFEHKADATEFVTPERAKDGSWKVSGYFIK
jgi:hypothetical protein